LRRHDTLTTAVRATDLPTLIAELYPQAEAKPGTPGLVFASWRNNTNTPACSLTHKKGVWLWHDMAEGTGGNAFDFLVKAHGMSPQEAANYLIDRAGIARGDDEDRLRPLPQRALDGLSHLKTGVAIKSLKGRGFNKAIVEAYGIRADGDDALIPITSPEGVVMQVKRRVHGVKGNGKYRYEHKGHGAPAWCSSTSRQDHTLLLVEGELNAIVADAALKEAGYEDIGVMGMAGAKTDLYPGLCLGKTVFIYADDDKAGNEAKDTWADRAKDEGARSVLICPGSEMDFCDFAGSKGRAGLATHIVELMSAAVQRYGALDRMLANGSVQDYLASADRFITGGVMHRTGFDQLDAETGGIRESGVFSIAALSSMGKSAVLRRILLEQVRAGGTIRLYSPDQSARTIYRLLASLLSGVGVHELRTGKIGTQAERLWGDAVAAHKAWSEAHRHVILELSQRFQVSEEGEAAVIFEDMERAVDQGVTMFGIDYQQGIEPRDHRDRDGMVAKELRKLSHRIGAPVVAALQLAKYKYPPSRASGVPVASDIEGSGSYYQDSEVVMMLYNESIYKSKYAGDNFEPLGHMDEEAFLYVVKDKEGAADGVYRVRWDKRLITYYDQMFPWNLKTEREGLM